MSSLLLRRKQDRQPQSGPVRVEPALGIKFLVIPSLGLTDLIRGLKPTGVTSAPVTVGGTRGIARSYPDTASSDYYYDNGTLASTTAYSVLQYVDLSVISQFTAPFSRCQASWNNVNSFQVFQFGGSTNFQHQNGSDAAVFTLNPTVLTSGGPVGMVTVWDGSTVSCYINGQAIIENLALTTAPNNIAGDGQIKIFSSRDVAGLTGKCYLTAYAPDTAWDKGNARRLSVAEPWLALKPVKRVVYSSAGVADTTLAGAAAAVASASASLTTGIRLAGGATSVASASGALNTAIALAGSAAATSTTAASLNTQISLAGASSSQAAATGALSTQIKLDGAAIAQAALSAALSTQISLAGSAPAHAVCTGALVTQISLAGAAVAQATASAALNTQSSLAGNAVARANASGSLTTQILLAGSAVAQISVSGDLAGQAALLSGVATAVASSGGVLSTAISLRGTAIASPIFSGDLSTAIRFQGVVAAQATASGWLVDWDDGAIVYARAPRGGGYSPRPVSAPQRAMESPAGRPAGGADVRNKNCDRGSIR